MEWWPLRGPAIDKLGVGQMHRSDKPEAQPLSERDELSADLFDVSLASSGERVRDGELASSRR